jgi:hypothetical protein
MNSRINDIKQLTIEVVWLTLFVNYRETLGREFFLPPLYN